MIKKIFWFRFCSDFDVATVFWTGIELGVLGREPALPLLFISARFDLVKESAVSSLCCLYARLICIPLVFVIYSTVCYTYVTGGLELTRDHRCYSLAIALFKCWTSALFILVLRLDSAIRLSIVFVVLLVELACRPSDQAGRICWDHGVCLHFAMSLSAAAALELLVEWRCRLGVLEIWRFTKFTEFHNLWPDSWLPSTENLLPAWGSKGSPSLSEQAGIKFGLIGRLVIT